ncbi:MAG: sigma-54-dependent Fis family transcriptional regulator, partial [Bdellovibrio sp.]|nr:sigma-54-dependent Fis family transcriptional regulator [Bdellovibrio sp.]
SITVPALRERKEDILPLAEHFVTKYSTANSKVIDGLTTAANDYLVTQHWPGNVRELENRIERAVVLASGGMIELSDLLHSDDATKETAKKDTLNFLMEKVVENRILPLEEMNRLYIQYALEINLGAKEKTAKDLGIDRKTLYRKLTR